MPRKFSLQALKAKTLDQYQLLPAGVLDLERALARLRAAGAGATARDAAHIVLYEVRMRFREALALSPKPWLSVPKCPLHRARSEYNTDS